MAELTRRAMLTDSCSAAVAAGLPLPALAADDGGSAAPPQLKVVVAGAHPDDPESGCGGTMARYAELGHEVVALYLTRGEAGIRGKSHQQAAEIRTAEAKKACSILKARPRFLTQTDGATVVDAARYQEVQKVLAEEQPNIVFTHWPIDTHRDHRVISLLVYDAWLRLGRQFALYYFEVNLGGQTQHFWPTHYVDITATEPAKRAACMAHVSQHPEGGFYTRYHQQMHRLRGMEYGCQLAEAFVHHVRAPAGSLPA